MSFSGILNELNRNYFIVMYIPGEILGMLYQIFGLFIMLTLTLSELHYFLYSPSPLPSILLKIGMYYSIITHTRI